MNSRMDHSKNVETYEIDLFKERERVEEKRFLKDGLSRRAAMNTRFHSGSYEKLGKACKRVASEDPPEKIDALSTKESITTPVVNEFDWETFKKKMQRDSSANRTLRVRQKSTTSVGRRNNIFFSSSPSLHDDSSLNDNQEDDLEKRTRSMTIG